jgi:hypothetical protein
MNAEGTDDADLRCPACADHPRLVAAGGALGGLRCNPCGAALLPPRGAAALRGVLGRAAAALDGAMSARTITCPSCSLPSPLVALPAGLAAPCAGCGTVWADGALYGWAEARLGAGAGPPSAAPARPAPPSVQAPAPSTPGGPAARSAWRRAPVLAGAGAVLALAVAALLLRPGPEGAGPPTSPTAWRDAPFARAASGPAPGDEPPASAATPAPRRPAAPPPDLLLGGRPIEWWQARLARLHGADDEPSRRLFEATQRRAEANGLVVSISGATVSVSPGAQLLQAPEGQP